ncbi:ABC transporter ATP-binding protein [Corynebacterium diphtheriae]|uniref:ABC transporter ATP-binding protein n=1 Tax=Corynebacterium diphtheriae TaxID=1717 RepID=UPI00024692BD|nr:ABC transporter ATP-binding protein [Corynebacterium diphtheriae]AEX69575.1 ABC transporter ATP-binding protein [Corynebacterium diphtheriae PW8]OKY22879.1 ABC transporter ATP-binding protein [Corynebacterium diphtheriae]UEB40023.1 energy-coupling factor ABC transporter ATP-binding protein [Corynebacterium diphtheriae]WLF43596.1 ABC transporter ATP-binding protein [Corynebacterium diphtheriae]CAB0594114.1 ABC transporter ATP-binding protein [Corynebacterium diphtheriae]
MTDHVIAHAFSYRHASRRKPALVDLTLKISRGERVLLLGASGSGKSTLLAAIAGVLADEDGEHSGELQVSGTPGMVLQDPDSQVISSRVGDDVAFGCENMCVPRDQIWPRVTQALAQVGLDLPLDHPTSELSGGQKQRLALAGVIAMGADIVLLDEPTANLDPDGVREVVSNISRAVETTGATMIVVEHRVSTWLDHVDRIIALGPDGRVLADGPARDVIAKHGRELSELGIWVPENDPQLPAALTPTHSDTAIHARELAVGWNQPLGTYGFDIPAGASTVITGANGKGKSTFLLTLAGLLPAHSGRVEVAHNIARGLHTDPLRWKSKELSSRFGFVFQDPEHQFVAATVREEMRVGLHDHNHLARADLLLERLRLDHLAEANPFTLSGGQKRRLSVATILVNTPDVVFLDEPTFGQDRTTFIELVTLLRELTDAGTTVVSITHDELYRRCLGDKEIAL